MDHSEKSGVGRVGNRLADDFVTTDSKKKKPAETAIDTVTIVENDSEIESDNEKKSKIKANISNDDLTDPRKEKWIGAAVKNE